MKKNILWIALAVVLIAGAGGYFLGVEQGKAQAASVRERFTAERFGIAQPNGQAAPGQFLPAQGGTGQAGMLNRGATGTVKGIQGNTILVSTAEKELKVQVTADTRITMTTQGSITDIKVGDRIIIGGQTQGDTMTATQIQIVPETP